MDCYKKEFYEPRVDNSVRLDKCIHRNTGVWQSPQPLRLLIQSMETLWLTSHRSDYYTSLAEFKTAYFLLTSLTTHVFQYTYLSTVIIYYENQFFINSIRQHQYTYRESQPLNKLWPNPLVIVVIAVISVRIMFQRFSCSAMWSVRGLMILILG